MIKKLILSNFIYQVIAMLASLCTLIVANRYLGPEGRGIYNSAIAWSQLYFTLSYLSMNVSLINLLPKEKSKKKLYVFNSIFLSIVLSLFIYILIYILYTIKPDIYGEINYYILFIAFINIPFMMIITNFKKFYQMDGEYKKFNFLFIAHPLLVLFLTLLTIVLFSFDIYMAMYIYTFVNLIIFSIVVSDFIIRKKITAKIKINLQKKLFKLGIKIHISSLATFAASKVDLLMINYFLGAKLAGLYFLAYAILSFLFLIPQSIQHILYKVVADLSHEDDYKMVFFMTRISTLLLVVATVALVVIGEPLILLFGGNEFMDSYSVLVFLSPFVLFSGIPMILTTLWHKNGYFKYNNYNSIIGLLLVILLNYFLIPKYGLEGAIISTNIVFFVGLLLHWNLARIKYNTSLCDIFIINKNDINVLLNKLGRSN